MKPELTVSERPRQPFYPTRLLNLVGRFRKPIVLEPEGLIKAAERATGLTDWGGDAFREALEAYCRAVIHPKVAKFRKRFAHKLKSSGGPE